MQTKMINCFKTKSLTIFVVEIFVLFVWLLEFFAPPKTWLLDLHQVKIMCNADFKMLLVQNTT